MTSKKNKDKKTIKEYGVHLGSAINKNKASKNKEVGYDLKNFRKYKHGF